MEVSLKRTRRIEIARYTRRVTRPLDDDATAAYAAAIDALSMTPEYTRSTEDQAYDSNGQPGEPENRANQRRSWFWLEWLKRE